MLYAVGDEIRYALDGRFGIITDVDEENGVYKVEIDGEEIEASECEVC